MKSLTMCAAVLALGCSTSSRFDVKHKAPAAIHDGGTLGGATHVDAGTADSGALPPGFDASASDAAPRSSDSSVADSSAPVDASDVLDSAVDAGPTDPTIEGSTLPDGAVPFLQMNCTHGALFYRISCYGSPPHNIVGMSSDCTARDPNTGTIVVGHTEYRGNNSGTFCNVTWPGHANGVGFWSYPEGAGWHGKRGADGKIAVEDRVAFADGECTWPEPIEP